MGPQTTQEQALIATLEHVADVALLPVFQIELASLNAFRDAVNEGTPHVRLVVQPVFGGTLWFPGADSCSCIAYMLPHGGSLRLWEEVEQIHKYVGDLALYPLCTSDVPLRAARGFLAGLGILG
uniref:Uncharacterized protein n=1 Tax=uncultured marine virus TaxID=186617 RepID=A0A0F7L0E0_9VIRU|nr:hypothetical protein [uncultured marine virus]